MAEVTTWMRVLVDEDGLVSVIDEVEGVRPDSFATVNSDPGEELARLLLSMAVVKSALSGIDPGEEADLAVAWLERRGYGRARVFGGA